MRCASAPSRACLTPYVARPSRRPSCLPTATRHPMRSPQSYSVGSSGRTAPYKFPRIVAYVDELPKTVNGKIRRAAIRDNDENENKDGLV